MTASSSIRLLAAVAGVVFLLASADVRAENTESYAVGVFSFDEFYYPNANFAFNAENTVELLQTCGVPCRPVTSEMLADPEVVNATRFPILLNIYGDAFPAIGEENLRRYHQQGGCLVSNGVPFGFECIKTSDGWRGGYPAESASPRRHDAIGTGMWKRLGSTDRIYYNRAKDEIGLEDLPLTSVDADIFFGLDPASLPREDLVIPIVTVLGEGGEAVAVGIIEHHCNQFSGAIDIWAGSHLYSEPLPLKIAIQQQLFVRSCAWLLEKRGLIDTEEREGIIEAARTCYASVPVHVGKWPMPEVRVEPGKAVPQSGKPAEEWVVVDLRGVDVDTRRTAICLQGLLNRSKPSCYVIATDEDEHWLKWLGQEPVGPETVRRLTVEGFLTEFAKDHYPAIIYDNGLLHAAANAATAWAASRNAVVATPEVVEQYGLSVAEDLRDHGFKTSHEAFEWALNKWGDVGPRRAAVLSPDKDLFTDYLMTHRVFSYWVSGPRDSTEPGGDVLGEVVFAQRLVSALPLNTPVFGFGHAALYRGLGESETVEMVSRFGKYQMVTGRTPNLSILSGIHVDSLKQKRRESPILEPGRIYVALVVSDGDNLNYWHSRFPKLWKDPARGTFPINWTIGPGAIDLEAPFIEKAYQDATENDHFVAAVSGAGYVYPEIYGTAYSDPTPILDGFLDQTRALMERLDITTVHIHHHGPYGETSPATLSRYAQKLSGLPGGASPALFVGYSRRDYASTYERSHFDAIPGVPAFYSLSQGNVATVVSDIGAAVGENRPAFVFAVTHPWRLKPKEFKKEFDALGPDFTLVTTEELASLYRQYQKDANGSESE